MGLSRFSNDKAKSRNGATYAIYSTFIVNSFILTLAHIKDAKEIKSKLSYDNRNIDLLRFKVVAMRYKMLSV